MDTDLDIRDRAITRFTELLGEITGIEISRAQELTVDCHHQLRRRVTRRQPTRETAPQLAYPILTTHETQATAAS